MRAMILVVLMLLPAQASAFLARNGMTAHGSGPAGAAPAAGSSPAGAAAGLSPAGSSPAA